MACTMPANPRELFRLTSILWAVAFYGRHGFREVGREPFEAAPGCTLQVLVMAAPCAVLLERLGGPLMPFPASGQGNAPAALDGLWRPSLRLPGPCWAKGHEGGDACPSSPFPVSPLFDPGRRPGVEWSGRPSSRHLPAAAARSGGQGRRRLAPGPEPHAATHSGRLRARAWRARRGPTPCSQRAPWHLCRLSTGQELSTAEKFNFFLSSDSWGRNALILLIETRVDQRKRAGRSEETGG